METAVLFSTALFLAYANGANDNAKGGPLYGSGALGYRAAITLATFVGGTAALFLAQGLVAGFSGKGLVPPETAAAPAFAAAVAWRPAWPRPSPPPMWRWGPCGASACGAGRPAAG